MPKSKNNAAVAGARMKVHPDQHDGPSEQEREAAAYGMARKPQVGEIVEHETLQVDDLDLGNRSGGFDAFPQQVDEPMQTATVSRGRTVEAPIPGKKRQVGYITDTGKPVYGPVMQRFGPGQVVSLPASEVRRLRELGFLVDPEQIEPAIQETGRPTVDQADTHQFVRRA